MADGKRPGAATGAAVVELIFSAIGIIVSIAGVAGGAVAALFGGGTLIGLTLVLGLVSSVGGLLVSVLGFIGSIMLLASKKGGIGLSKFWVFGTFVLYGVTVVNVFSTMSTVTAAADTMMSGTDLNVSASAIGAGVGIVTAVVALFWMVAPAVVVLILLSQKAVKEFFGAPA